MKATITTVFFCIILWIDSTKCQTLRCRDVVQISREGEGNLNFMSNKDCESESDACFKASAELTYNDGSQGEMIISSCIPRDQCSAVSTCDDFLPAASNYVNSAQQYASLIENRLNDVVNKSSCCFGFCSTNQCNDEVTAEQLGCDSNGCNASPETTRIGTLKILCLLFGCILVIFM